MRNLDLALIGNCTLGARIDERAEMVWACSPRFDGGPVFCSLLAGERRSDDSGFRDVELLDFARSEHAYLENTAILVTRPFDRHCGGIEVTGIAPRFGQCGRMFRPMSLINFAIRLSVRWAQAF